MLTDEEIVNRIVNGEINLYETLIRKYNQRLYRIGRSIINDDQEVEDIMQTTYLNAYLKLSSFKNKSTFGTWLTKILINESLLHKKRKVKLDNILIEKQRADYHTDTPLNNLMNSELKTILEKSISVLPEKYRLVFVLREIEEISTNETMEMLNLSESNVKVRLTRAKEMLRDSLSNHYKSSGIYDFHLTRCDRITHHVMEQIRKNVQQVNID